MLKPCRGEVRHSYSPNKNDHHQREHPHFAMFACYGDAGQNGNPNLYAFNPATGVETLLGNEGALTGSGSFGPWTVSTTI